MSDGIGYYLNLMFVFVKNGLHWKRLSVGNSVGGQSTYATTDDFIKKMNRHVLPNNTVNHMYVEENKKIPLSNGEEIRIIAQLASSYHNAVVYANLKGEKDLYRNSYTPDEWPEPQSISSDVPQPKIKVTRGNFAHDDWDEELKATTRHMNSTRISFLGKWTKIGKRDMGYTSRQLQQGKKVFANYYLEDHNPLYSM